MTIKFSRKIFEKNDQISNFMSFRPVGAELLHVDRRTDRQTGRRNEARQSIFEIWRKRLKN